MSKIYGTYQITLDKELVEMIREIIELEREANQLGQESVRYYQIEQEIDDHLRSLAWMIVYSFKELPF